MTISEKELMSSIFKRYNIENLADLKKAYSNICSLAFEHLVEYVDCRYNVADFRNEFTDHTLERYTSVFKDDFLLFKSKKKKRVCLCSPKSLETDILNLHINGASQKLIIRYVNSLYNLNITPDIVERITDKLLDIYDKWNTRELKDKYLVLALDSVEGMALINGEVVRVQNYYAFGIGTFGEKEIVYTKSVKSSENYTYVDLVRELKKRGMENASFIIVNGEGECAKEVSQVFEDSVNCSVAYKIKEDKAVSKINHEDRESLEVKSEFIGKEEIFNHNKELKRMDIYAPYGDLEGNVYELGKLVSCDKIPEMVREIIESSGLMNNIRENYKKVFSRIEVYSSFENMEKSLYLASYRLANNWRQAFRNWRELKREAMKVGEGG